MSKPHQHDEPCNYNDACNNLHCKYYHKSGKNRPGLHPCPQQNLCRNPDCHCQHAPDRVGLNADCEDGEYCHIYNCKFWHDNHKKRLGLTCPNGSECDGACMSDLEAKWNQLQQEKDAKKNESSEKSKQRREAQQKLDAQLKQDFVPIAERKRRQEQEEKERREKRERDEIAAKKRVASEREREENRRRQEFMASGKRLCKFGERCFTKGCVLAHLNGSERAGLTFCPQRSQCEDPLCDYGHPNAQKPPQCYGGDRCGGKNCRFAH